MVNEIAGHHSSLSSSFTAASALAGKHRRRGSMEHIEKSLYFLRWYAEIPRVASLFFRNPPPMEPLYFILPRYKAVQEFQALVFTNK